MKIKLTQIFGSLALMALVNHAQANLGSIATIGDPITGTNAINAASMFAQSFTTGATNYLLGNAILNMGSAGNSSGLTMTLNANNGGNPGAVLATYTANGNSVLGNGIMVGLNTFDTNSTLVLSPNTPYWLEAKSSTSFLIRTTTSTISSSSQGWTLGGNEEDLNSAGWTSDPENFLFSINATVTTPTPEPATLALGALGAGALLRFRRRK